MKEDSGWLHELVGTENGKEVVEFERNVFLSIPDEVDNVGNQVRRIL